MQDSIGAILESIVKQECPYNDVALLLSGGVDSLSCGFAAHKLGKRVHAYTFQIGERSNQDSRSAQAAALKMGWQFTLIKVPIENLRQDFLLLANKWGCVKKTQFECTFPFLYLIPEIKESYILSGIAADGHFGLSKKAMIHYRYPKAKFDEFRTQYFSSANPAGQVQQKAIIEYYGKHQIAPYLDRRVFDYFIQFDHDQINKPYQKILTLRSYPEWFNLVGVRLHQNLQLISGIDSVFESLLSSPLNTKKRKRVMDLCRDYAKTKTGATEDDE